MISTKLLLPILLTKIALALDTSRQYLNEPSLTFRYETPANSKAKPFTSPMGFEQLIEAIEHMPSSCKSIIFTVDEPTKRSRNENDENEPPVWESKRVRHMRFIELIISPNTYSHL